MLSNFISNPLNGNKLRPRGMPIKLGSKAPHIGQPAPATPKNTPKVLVKPSFFADNLN